MCATAPVPRKGRPPTLPDTVVVGVGTTWAAGSAWRRHTHLGNVHSGSLSFCQPRSHSTSPAVPAALSEVITTSPAPNQLSSCCRCAGDGPKRSYDGVASGGKVAIHPCAYASPLVGAT